MFRESIRVAFGALAYSIQFDGCTCHTLVGSIAVPRYRATMNHIHASQQDRVQLEQEVRFFKEQSYKLKQMFKETVKVLSDLQSFKESLSLDVLLDVQAQR